VVGRDELSELGVGLAIDEEVHESVRSGVDRITRAGEIADVHDRELPALVRRGDHRAHRLLAERGERHAIRVAVVVHELDVVRPFRDPRVTNAWRESGSVMVGIVMPYSVPWPFGTVTSVPAENRSARSVAFPAACSARAVRAAAASLNMSSSVVTPKMRAVLLASPNV
jgi:hypothetical protein